MFKFCRMAIESISSQPEKRKVKSRSDIWVVSEKLGIMIKVDIKNLSQNYFSINNYTTWELNHSKVVLSLFLIASRQFSKSIMPWISSFYNPSFCWIFFTIRYRFYFLFIIFLFSSLLLSFLRDRRRRFIMFGILILSFDRCH